jgi:hypothetical protein
MRAMRSRNGIEVEDPLCDAGQKIIWGRDAASAIQANGRTAQCKPSRSQACRYVSPVLCRSGGKLGTESAAMWLVNYLCQAGPNITKTGRHARSPNRFGGDRKHRLHCLLSIRTTVSNIWTSCWKELCGPLEHWESLILFGRLRSSVSAVGVPARASHKAHRTRAVECIEAMQRGPDKLQQNKSIISAAILAAC